MTPGERQARDAAAMFEDLEQILKQLSPEQRVIAEDALLHLARAFVEILELSKERRP